MRLSYLRKYYSQFEESSFQESMKRASMNRKIEFLFGKFVYNVFELTPIPSSGCHTCFDNNHAKTVWYQIQIIVHLANY